MRVTQEEINKAQEGGAAQAFVEQMVSIPNDELEQLDGFITITLFGSNKSNVRACVSDDMLPRIREIVEDVIQRTLKHSAAEKLADEAIEKASTKPSAAWPFPTGPRPTNNS